MPFKTCRSVVGPKYKLSSMSPASCLTKENNSKLNGVVFDLILTYLLPIECYFNHYLAKEGFRNDRTWIPVTNYFPSAGFKI